MCRCQGAQFTPHREAAIRFGLAAVKNVGGNAIESILKARAEAGGRFKSFWEFCEKVDLRVMNKRVIESLIKAGALDSLGTRGQLMAAVDKAMERAQKTQRDAEQGQSGLFGLFDETPARGRDADALPAAADWEEGERLANEKEVLGFFVSGHPLDKYAEKLRNLTGVITVAEALERKPPERRWGGQPDPADEIQVAGMHSRGARAEEQARPAALCAGRARRRDRQDRADLLCARLRAAGAAVEDRGAGAGARTADGRRRCRAEDRGEPGAGARRRAGEAAERRAHPHQSRSRDGRDARALEERRGRLRRGREK